MQGKGKLAALITGADIPPVQLLSPAEVAKAGSTESHVFSIIATVTNLELPLARHNFGINTVNQKTRINTGLGMGFAQ